MIVRPTLFALGALCLSTARLGSALAPSDIPVDTPVAHLVSSANANLLKGNAQDALIYFDAAIQRDPTNYLTIFKRGATYLSLGRNTLASKDFDHVLELKPGFEGALTQRARIKQRNADWTGAREDYKAAGKKTGEEIQAIDDAESAAKQAAQAEDKKDWETCVTQAGVAILVASTSLELRQRRAHCRFERGEMIEGMADLNHVLQINPSATQPSLEISAMTFYSLGETDKGIAAISKCLHNDPDNKACLKLRKSEKSVERTLKKFRQLVEKRQYASAVKMLIPTQDDPGLLQEVKDDTKIYRDAGYILPAAGNKLYEDLIERACEAYTEMNNKPKAESYCKEALQYNPTNLPGLLGRAQRQIDLDDFEAAMSTLNEAAEAHGNNNQKIQELQQKAQTLLKRSKQKDYYKVLGVSRDADEREIKKAFRKLTREFHPDKAAQRGVTQEEAQKKMSAINEAYEVLSDPELKERFDRGEDPNDPTAGQQPFQGSPFGFGPGGQPVFFQQRSGSSGGGGGGFKFQAGGPGGGFQFPGGFPFG